MHNSFIPFCFLLNGRHMQIEHCTFRLRLVNVCQKMYLQCTFYFWEFWEKRMCRLNESWGVNALVCTRLSKSIFLVGFFFQLMKFIPIIHSFTSYDSWKLNDLKFCREHAGCHLNAPIYLNGFGAKFVISGASTFWLNLRLSHRSLSSGTVHHSRMNNSPSCYAFC